MENLKHLYLVYKILDDDKDYCEKGYDRLLPLEILLDGSRKLREAKNSILQKYRGNLECEINLPLSKLTYNELHITVEEKQSGYLEPAFTDFVSIGGIPLIIFKGSDYETAESVLRKYNKKLKKLPLNGLMGRFVVNLE
ncbi:MAG: hypothetical protein AABW45_03765 [Nanoarchaeota archaeon]